MNKNIKALIPPHDNPSYPSGHAAKSYIFAYILGSLISEKRQEFYNQAEQISKRRILVGMHYPRDIKGGRQLALVTYGALINNAKFQKDLRAAQKELRKTL